MNERRAYILDLVVRHYIRSAHPVPSSQVAEQVDVSSATVRNELSALEESGFLQQPHTSAGRVPTVEGYRYYARKFIPPKRLPEAQLRLLEAQLRGAHGDHLLQQIANVAAELSGYAVVVSLPADDELHAHEIHLSALSSSRVLAVVVLETGLIRQLVIDLTPTPSDDTLRDAESSLRQLTLPIGEVPRALYDIAKRTDAETARTFTALADAWPTLAPPRVFSQGLANLLAEPESNDPSFVRMVLERVEHPDTTPDTVGQEALVLVFEESLALVAARLELGTIRAGLRLFGPTRMRYPETLSAAQAVTEAVARRLSSGSELN